MYGTGYVPCGNRTWGPRVLIAVAGLIYTVGATIGAATIEADFYVSPSGRDSWSGKLPAPNKTRTDGPFATIDRAREAIAAEKAAGAPRSFRVHVRGGTYELTEPLVFTPADSAPQGETISYAAYPGERPVLSGGRRITGWRKGPGNLWVADVPEVRAGKWYFQQLFVNGQRRIRARHPNEGFLRAQGPLPEIRDYQADRNKPEATRGITYRPGDIKRWKNLGDVNIILFFDWSTSRHWIEALDEEARTVRFTNSSNWPVFTWEPDCRYRVENYFEALDQPGEWYLDREAAKVYYWPLPGEKLEKASVVTPVLQRLVEIRGEPEQGRFVTGLRFEGLAFHYADWRAEKTQSLEGQAAHYLSAAVLARGATDCSFERCEIAHVGEYGLWLDAGCKRCRVFHCELRDLGAGGVRVGEPAYREQPDLIAEANRVENCFVHDGGHTFPDGVGVIIFNSPYNVVAHNEICDILYSGISCGWSWGYGPHNAHHNIIEWNHVHHLGYGVLSELSAIYTLGVSPGTVIRYNWLHDTYDYKFGSWGLGLDEGTSGVLVENNLVYNHGHGLGLHYGHDNVVRNNILGPCRVDVVGVGRIEDAHFMDLSRNIIFGTVGTLAAGNFDKPTCTSDYNIWWDTYAGQELDINGIPWAEWQARGRDVHSLVADPLFVAPDKGDFRLRPNSPALALGFKPFDVSKAGLFGEKSWVEAPRRIKRAPFALPKPPTPQAITDGFEDTPVGAPPRVAQVYGQTGGASIRVTDETAASGKHSLKFTDAPGLEATWQPHMAYFPNYSRGAARVSFDVRLEEGARFVTSWRDWRQPEFATGPDLIFVAGGQLIAGGRNVTDVPVGKWIHCEVTCPLGSKSGRTWTLSVSIAGGKPTKVTNLPLGSERFVQFTWLGFVSDANDTAVTYLDNLKIEPLP